MIYRTGRSSVSRRVNRWERARAHYRGGVAFDAARIDVDNEKTRRIQRLFWLNNRANVRLVACSRG